MLRIPREPPRMRILVVGKGGREHALALKLSQSARCNALFIAPGNPGTAQCGVNVALDVKDHAAVIAFCQAERIDLVVVGPEAIGIHAVWDHVRA